MGLNFYLHRGRCESCGRSDEPLHIGKSSAGWCFLLHVIPELGINDLEDWRREWHSGEIRDEYNKPVSVCEMLNVIANRSWPIGWEEKFGKWPMDSIAERNFHGMNYSERGPNNLLRTNICLASRCVGHGAGTWDLIKGEFS